MAQRVSAQRVYDYVREMIVSKELFPGNRIVEEELADALHTSRTTVRNGIAALSYPKLWHVCNKAQLCGYDSSVFCAHRTGD